ncbi:hypothetical protein [Falsirhodobacter deserti]|uniref:hypothetical protein n=1 Tax=Falsirhodobacter deserti TaxID=1365611 RepID=UPI0030C7C37E
MPVADNACRTRRFDIIHNPAEVAPRKKSLRVMSNLSRRLLRDMQPCKARIRLVRSGEERSSSNNVPPILEKQVPLISFTSLRHTVSALRSNISRSLFEPDLPFPVMMTKLFTLNPAVEDIVIPAQPFASPSSIGGVIPIRTYSRGSNDRLIAPLPVTGRVTSLSDPTPALDQPRC